MKRRQEKGRITGRVERREEKSREKDRVEEKRRNNSKGE